MSDILKSIGEQLQRARRERNLSQADLALRLGRDRARISEFERELAANRLGRDRLTLLAEICDALDLIPLVVPRARAKAIRSALEDDNGGGISHALTAPSAFD